MDRDELASEVAKVAPALWSAVGNLSHKLCEPITERLAGAQLLFDFPKTIADPVWKVIEVYPHEVLLLDGPLLQRLRGIRQLGMANYVYPGATHDRLTHSLGVLEAATRMLRSLDRNRWNRVKYGADQDSSIPEISPDDEVAVRLAALLHDVGHGPFSHVSERIVKEVYSKELSELQSLLIDCFQGASKLAAAEAIAVLMILSKDLSDILSNNKFKPHRSLENPDQLPMAIVSLILGSHSYLKATYLSGIISGPIDADKLDYMARDSMATGVPLNVDIDRLIAKLEVVTVTAGAVTDTELKARAREAQHGRFYEMGISQAGLGAYEWMLIDRVMLYDRIYYHHKVRAAEAMIKYLLEPIGTTVNFDFFFGGLSDQTVLSILSGTVTSETYKSTPQGAPLAQDLQDRRLLKRSFAFARRHLSGLNGLDEDERVKQEIRHWSRIRGKLETDSQRRKFAKSILDKAIEISNAISGYKNQTQSLVPGSILVDFVESKTVSMGGNILVRGQSGHVSTPNLFFEPGKWTQAYEEHRQTGYVFAPEDCVQLVSIATRIRFLEEFDVVVDEYADQICKLRLPTDWTEQFVEANLISPDQAKRLTFEKPHFMKFESDSVRLPSGWNAKFVGIQARIADELNAALPSGIPLTDQEEFLNAFCAVLEFAVYSVSRAIWKDRTINEAELQRELADFLKTSRVHFLEGTEVGGGETDLILFNSVIVENKVEKSVCDPRKVKLDADYQSYTYAISVLQRLGITVLAYQPGSILSLDRCFEVKALAVDGEAAQVRVYIPFNQGNPSDAKAPPAAKI